LVQAQYNKEEESRWAGMPEAKECVAELGKHRNAAVTLVRKENAAGRLSCHAALLEVRLEEA